MGQAHTTHKSHPSRTRSVLCVPMVVIVSQQEHHSVSGFRELFVLVVRLQQQNRPCTATATFVVYISCSVVCSGICALKKQRQRVCVFVVFVINILLGKGLYTESCLRLMFAFVPCSTDLHNTREEAVLIVHYCRIEEP